MASGPPPVSARMVEVPSGSIFVTSLESVFAVYTFPAESIVIAYGVVPVVPRIVDVPSGSITDTSSEP